MANIAVIVINHSSPHLNQLKQQGGLLVENYYPFRSQKLCGRKLSKNETIPHILNTDAAVRSQAV